MLYQMIAVLSGIVLFAGTALAQVPTPANFPESTGQPSAQATPQEQDSELSASTAEANLQPGFTASSRAPLVWLRFRRFLSFNPVKDSELTLAITNRLLVEAQAQHSSQPARAAMTLESFARETTILQGLTATILEKTQNPQVSIFLDTLLTDKTLHLSLLESIKPASASELSRKIVTTRAKTLRDIVEVLEEPNISSAERQHKLDRIMQKYTEKETKIDRKIAKKLAFKDDLDVETDDPELEDELANEEDETLEEAVNELDKDELADFANELSRKEGNQGLVVLQKLLMAVPESAKSGIETAIDAVIVGRIESFRQNPATIEELLNEHSGSSKIRTLLLERIKEQANDENLKQQVELIKAKPEERAKKTKELQKETEKKASEKEKEDTKKQIENQEETSSPEAKPSEQSEVKSSSSPEIKSESTTVEIKIKEDGTLDKTSYTVKKNSLVTAKVESAFTSSITVSFGDGLGSVTVSKEDKKTLNPFVITNTVSFTANGTTGYIYTE